MQAEIDHQTTDQLQELEIPLRKSTRDRRSSIIYNTNEYVLLTYKGEPQCYAEAMEDGNRVH